MFACESGVRVAGQMAEEQSTEPDGYYAPSEEELLCPKPKFPKLATAEREVSIMEGTVYHRLFLSCK